MNDVTRTPAPTPMEWRRDPLTGVNEIMPEYRLDAEIRKDATVPPLDVRSKVGAM